MIINNPQDLTPILTAMREGLQADMNALSQSVSTEIDALTVVNGEIKTDVQAVNAHTTQELSKITPKRSSFTPVSAVYSSVSYMTNYSEKGNKTVLDIVGAGLLSELDETNKSGITIAQLVIDGLEVSPVIARQKVKVGGLEFSQSLLLVANSIGESRSNAIAAGALLGSYEWKE